jgi:Heavy-metal-associated domain
MNKIIIFLVLLLLSFTLVAKEKEPKTITVRFGVASVCGACEQTIEKAMDAKGIVAADYNLETKILEVIYRPSKIKEADLHRLLNEVGYDTDLSKATDEQYSKVHHCCKYRDMEDH